MGAQRRGRLILILLFRNRGERYGREDVGSVKEKGNILIEFRRWGRISLD